MPVFDLVDLPPALPPTAPVAGLDLGTRTIGVAVSDTTLTIASPLALIRREKFTKDAATLFELMDGRGAAGLVIGLPINMDGSEGPRCQSVRAFARHLMRLKDLPIAFWDERLSSAAVNRLLISQADASRARRAEAVDKMAAAWILQGALDRLAAFSPPHRGSTAEGREGGFSSPVGGSTGEAGEGGSLGDISAPSPPPPLRGPPPPQGEES